MVIIIGKGAAPLGEYLEENKLGVTVLSAEQIPSLTATLLAMTEVSDMVILPDAQKSWSLAHILSAAKQLQPKGKLVFFGHPGGLPPLISVAGSKEALLALLQKKAAKPSAQAGSGAGGQSQPAPGPQPLAVRPMAIPPGRILILGVAGSQPRIGCTTQAVSLWHYCKTLGFDPAVVAAREQTAQIAATMHGREIPGGYQIEGVPFVTDTALAYDCYILDIGTGSIPEALRAADHLVLVAGTKPWELPATAAALRAVNGQDVLVLLSFCTQRDAVSLRPLFGRQSVAVVPWMPELWTPSPRAMAIYDKLLRPVLEKLLTRPERQEEQELQLTKGV